ncbi:alginate biosynthesis protein Alg44, partial [Salmonella enterica subsp. enterica]
TYRQFGDVRPGTQVNFQVADEEQIRTGTIVSSTSLNSADLSSDIRVQIKPDAPLDSTYAGRPVEVTSDRGPSLNWLIDKAMAH